MKIKRIESNPLWPLPADYDSLDLEGRRQARTSAVQQWKLIQGYDPDSRRKRGLAFAACLRLFRNFYLMPSFNADGDVLFDPLFYDVEPVADAPFHDIISAKTVEYRKMVDVAPRGGAKSTKVAERIIFWLTTCPAYSIVYCTSSTDNTKDIGEKTRFQLYHNDRIRDDWDAEYGKPLKPVRGEMVSGIEQYMLGNRASFTAKSIESKQRGKRPRRYILDDPEHDAKASTAMESVREWMEVMLFKVVIPMLTRPDVACEWHGTYVSQRHYLHHAMAVRDSEGPNGEVTKKAADRRFDGWYRLEIPAGKMKGDTIVASNWPHMWPANDEEKERVNAHPDSQTLEQIRYDLGDPVFMSEMMARPGEGEDSYFIPPTFDKHGWWLEPVDDEPPHSSLSLICWNNRKGEEQKVPLREFIANTLTFATVDNADTENISSDSKVCTVMAYGYDGVTFVLDCYSSGRDPRQCPKHRFVHEIFRLADHWRARVIGVEAIGTGQALYEDCVDVVVNEDLEATNGIDYFPMFFPIKPGKTLKTSKISTLWSSIQHGSLKIPYHPDGTRVDDHPWDRLYNQWTGFSPYLADGGLQKDDELDTISMRKYITKGPGAALAAPPEMKRTITDRMVDGETRDEDGSVLGHRLLVEGTSEDLARVLHSRISPPPSRKEKNII